MKTHNKYVVISTIAFLILLVGVFSPLVYWFKNPELSKMQLFIETWHYSMLAIVSYVVICWANIR